MLGSSSIRRTVRRASQVTGPETGVAAAAGTTLLPSAARLGAFLPEAHIRPHRPFAAARPSSLSSLLRARSVARLVVDLYLCRASICIWADVPSLSVNASETASTLAMIPVSARLSSRTPPDHGNHLGSYEAGREE